MRLFTSSSDRPRWLASWLLALVLTFGLLSGWEFWLRSEGYGASAGDSKALWSWNRSAVNSGKRSIALLGTSRMLLGVSIETLREMYPDYGVYQLGINGQYPIATLLDLAEDNDFIGIAVVSTMAQGLEARYFEMQQPYVDYFRSEKSLDRQFNAVGKALIGGSLVMLRPELGVQAILNYWSHRSGFPPPPYVRFFPNRSIAGNYSLTDAGGLRQHLVEQKRRDYSDHPATPVAQWLSNLLPVEAAVRRIQERGGRVIFIRFPTQGGHWKLDEEFYPKADYWQSFAESSSALTIHFQDVPGVPAINLPDGSHVDQKDKSTLTQLLFGAIGSLDSAAR